MIRAHTACLWLALLTWVCTAAAEQTPVGTQPELLRTEVIHTYPHDTQAYTQGLLLYHGKLYESAGRYRLSDLREVDPSSGRIIRSVRLADNYFGEGLALVGQRLIQLTWMEHVALQYDRATFAPLGQFMYTTEGWGICYDGTRLVMSDGTNTLYFRDPTTFAVLGQVGVTLGAHPRPALNELECVGDAVFANVWRTDNIVRINPRTGMVTAVIDASGLLTQTERASSDVLNGIAYDADHGTFLITGKLWPKLFEVRFVPSGH